MKYISIILCSLLFISSVSYAENVIGVVDLAVGKISIIRAGKKIKPKRGMEIKLQDKITLMKNARFIVKLLDGNKIEVPEGEEVGVEDIIVKALSGRSTSALAAFQEFLKKLAKDKKYDSVMIATMGARGIVDETVIKKSIEEINKLLPAEKDPAVILDLLLMKADLYLELGDYKQARIIYEELKTRDKNKIKTEEINGLLALLQAIGNKQVGITLFKSENTEISHSIFDILCTDLSNSGMLQISDKTDDKIPGSGIQYLLTGDISYRDTDVTICATLTDVQSGKVMETWTIPAHKNTLPFCSRQLAGLVHHRITGKGIPSQNFTQYLDEPEGIEKLDEVDVYLGLNKDGVLPVYKLEEKLIIHCKLNGNIDKMYYITIICIGPDGEVNQLFPNSYKMANKIHVNKRYTFPETNSQYYYSVYGNPGKNYIICIVTEHPLTLADNKKIKEEVFPILSTNPDEYLQKGLQVYAAKSSVKKWRIGVTHFMAAKE